MTKTSGSTNINVELPNAVYYRLLEVKARRRCRTWGEFLKRIVEEA